MTPIRVALLVSSLLIDGPGGGVGRFTHDLSLALTSDEIQVKLYALWGDGSSNEQVLRDRLAQAGVESLIATHWVEAHPYQTFGRAVTTLQRAFAASPVDIVHAHHEFADVAALWLSRAAGAHTVMRTVHNQEWRRRPARRLFLSNGLYPIWFTAEAGVSRAIVERLNRRPVARLLRRRAYELPNAIDIDRFRTVPGGRQRTRAELGITPETLLIGTVGRLSLEKGYQYWLEAAALTARALDNVHFLLVGSGNQEQALKQQAQALGIAHRVTFAGARPNVEQFYECMDLFVSSSLSEGLPTVILESMAAGVPVLATDISGTRELLVKGENGWIVPARDAPALSAAMTELIMDTARRSRYVERAMPIVRRFSIKSIAMQHAHLYQALSNHGAAAAGAPSGHLL